MADRKRIAFLASEAESAQAGQAELVAMHGNCAPEEADLIVALGGDGFMLRSMG